VSLKNHITTNLIIKTQLDEKIIPQWEHFIASHPNGSVLQSWFSYRLFEMTENFNPVFISCQNSENHLIGILLGVLIKEKSFLKKHFSSRVVVYGGPLINEDYPDKPQIFQALIKNLIELVKRKSIFIQFRASYDLSTYSEIFKNYRFKWVPRLNLLIDTSDRLNYSAGLSASKRRQIRKSLSNGAKIIEPSTINQVKSFYKILYTLYKEKVRKPLPDWSFFESFYHLIQTQNKGKFFLIEYQNKIIGGIMSPYMPEKSLFEWYVCGLDNEFRDKGVFPSVLATWAAIDHAGKSGCRIFDFMGVGKPDEPYGVRDFKMKFGGRQVNYGRYIRINNQFLYAFAELGYNFLTWIKKV